MTDKKTILVIDDEERICQSFEKALAREGYDVISFTDGSNALERMKEGGIDLVVSDLMMPEKTGLDILQEMREGGIETNLVMITGYASIENALETMRHGAVDYLPKPFTLAELKGVVARGLCASEINPEDMPKPPAGTYEIRNHSWMRKTGDDEVVVGVHPFVLRCGGRITEVELPMEEDELVQGGAFGKLQIEESRVPVRLWSPVSGDVKETNSKAVENPVLVTEDPYGAGWLLKLKPTHYEENLKFLVAVS